MIYQKQEIKSTGEKSVGYIVNFIYDNINGAVEITDYFKSESKKSQYLTINYKGIKHNIQTQRFKSCDLHSLLSYKAYDIIKPKYQIGTIIKDEKRELLITDYIVKDVKKNKKYYKYKCLKCGYKDGQIEESHISVGYGCSCCAGKVVIGGINDIPTTDPWMVPYFQGGYEESKTYTAKSNVKKYFKCPYCNTVISKPIAIHNLANRRHISCKKCSDGYSSIAKYFYSVLNQLKNLESINDFVIEQKYDWCKFYNPYKDKLCYGLYDFVIEDEKIIIEIDGEFHRIDNSFSGQTKKESFFIDNEKDKLAHENGYTIIRISNENDFKQNILASNFSKLFDLSDINWDECLSMSMKTYAYDICIMKYNNPELTVPQLSKLTKFSETSIRRWLKIGNSVGWCYYNPYEEVCRVNKNIKSGCKELICIENKNVYTSISECSKMSSFDIGINISASLISRVCNNKTLHARGYHFKFISDLTPEEYKIYDVEDKIKEIKTA